MSDRIDLVYCQQWSWNTNWRIQLRSHHHQQQRHLRFDVRFVCSLPDYLLFYLSLWIHCLLLRLYIRPYCYNTDISYWRLTYWLLSWPFWILEGVLNVCLTFRIYFFFLLLLVELPHRTKLIFSCETPLSLLLYKSGWKTQEHFKEIFCQHSALRNTLWQRAVFRDQA